LIRQQNDGDQPGAEASYTYSPILITRWGGGIEHADVSTNYYKTGSEVTPGTANASGTITFTYNKIFPDQQAGEQ
jgi:type 1 fimbria pilin